MAIKTRSGSEALSALERIQRMTRIRIWLDDVTAFSEELTVRAPDGELHSYADNEWLWNEKGRLLEIAATLLREVWLEGLEHE